MKMHALIRDRGGFALPIAIVALVVVAVLVVGGFVSVRQEFRTGMGTDRANTALYTAEEGITRTLAGWSAGTMSALPLWGEFTTSGTTAQGEWTVATTRIGERNFLLESTGLVSEGAALGPASRRVGMLVRVRTANLDPPAALTTRGNVRVRGTAEVHGGDVNPVNWGPVCSPTSPANNKPGVMTDATGTVTTQGSAEVTGNPPSVQNPDITGSTFTTFGDMTWADLVSLATKTYPGGNFNNTWPELNPDGTCDTGHATNWGDPLNPIGPCGGYFPIIHIAGNARIQSGAVGQGILLVDGDLDLRGNFTFHGIVIVQGALGTQGSGNRILGGVWAGNAELEDQTLVGGSVVQYSTCAATRAITGNDALSRARPIAERSWIDLSANSMD